MTADLQKQLEEVARLMQDTQVTAKEAAREDHKQTVFREKDVVQMIQMLVRTKTYKGTRIGFMPNY